ncbi:MAG: rhomboid family intramembrane serine protease, partial [Bacteroidota bacterium]
WLHYAFNMVALVSFSETLEIFLGFGNTLVVYFGSLLGGSLLALYFHRNHGDYKAVGASGAVSGIVMAYIVLFPDGGIGFPGVDLSIKAWIFGPLYVILSIVGIKYSVGNIGHDAHLGGAIIGAILAAAYRPGIAIENWWVLALIIIPCAIFLTLLARNPNMMLIPNDWGTEVKSLQHYQKKINRKEEIDRILDKINRKGIDSLTLKERRLLEGNDEAN